MLDHGKLRIHRAGLGQARPRSSSEMIQESRVRRLLRPGVVRLTQRPRGVIDEASVAGAGRGELIFSVKLVGPATPKSCRR